MPVYNAWTNEVFEVGAFVRPRHDILILVTRNHGSVEYTPADRFEVLAANEEDDSMMLLHTASEQLYRNVDTRHFTAWDVKQPDDDETQTDIREAL